MIRNTGRHDALMVLALGLAILLLITGCSVLNSKEVPDPGESNAIAEDAAKDAPVYYDFGDVLIPRELEVDKDNSFVFHTPGLTAGVMAMTGNVEVNSLITFFENKMPVDGWRQISAFKAPRSMMLFKKQTRWCVISIIEGQFSTRVEIWVAPTMEEVSTGLRK